MVTKNPIKQVKITEGSWKEMGIKGQQSFECFSCCIDWEQQSFEKSVSFALTVENQD